MIPTTQIGKKIVIIGGGISGLAMGHFIRRKGMKCKILLIEASDRMGGYIESTETPTKALFMNGPRTLRASGIPGLAAIKLVEQLNLQNNIIPYKKSDRNILQKYIKIDSKLVLVDKNILKHEALECKGLWSLVWRELTAPRCITDDESVHSFVARRGGLAVADLLADCLMRGIFAGDARKISMRSAMPIWHQHEKDHGSVLKGAALRTVGQKVNLANMALGSATWQRSNAEKWTAFTLMGGLSTLVNGLIESNHNAGVEMKLGAAVMNVDKKSDRMTVCTTAGDYPADYVISCVPANIASPMLSRLSPTLSQLLGSIPFATVAVANLEFKQPLPLEGFGYLVPSGEKGKVLGVIFDSCQYPITDTTVLTVLMGGVWFEEHFGASPSEDDLLNVALDEVSSTLGLKDAIHSRVTIIKDCIPQYEVGHYEKMCDLRKTLISERLPVALCGNSYSGVGVPDTILDTESALDDLYKTIR